MSFLDNGTGDEKPPLVDSEIVKPSSSTNELDEIDQLLKGYTKKMDIPAPAPGPAAPGTQFGPGGYTSQSAPFVTHEPSAIAQDYYKRGAKKGQPKPPKKGLAPPLNPAGQMQIQATALISGALFVTMIDIIFPLIIAGLNNWRSKLKVDPDKMKMTQSQRNDLAPIGDGIVRELKLNASPVALGCIALIGIYSANLLSLRSIAEKDLQKEKLKNDTIKRQQDHEENLRKINEERSRQNPASNLFN